MSLQWDFDGSNSAQAAPFIQKHSPASQDGRCMSCDRLSRKPGKLQSSICPGHNPPSSIFGGPASLARVLRPATVRTSSKTLEPNPSPRCPTQASGDLQNFGRLLIHWRRDLAGRVLVAQVGLQRAGDNGIMPLFLFPFSFSSRRRKYDDRHQLVHTPPLAKSRLSHPPNGLLAGWPPHNLSTVVRWRTTTERILFWALLSVAVAPYGLLSFYTEYLLLTHP